MPNYFYIDQSGQKQGPVDDPQLQLLATQGIITPQTPLETDTGLKGLAGQIPSLKFSKSPVQSSPSIASKPQVSRQMPSNNNPAPESKNGFGWISGVVCVVIFFIVKGCVNSCNEHKSYQTPQYYDAPPYYPPASR